MSFTNLFPENYAFGRKAYDFLLFIAKKNKINFDDYLDTSKLVLRVERKGEGINKRESGERKEGRGRERKGREGREGWEWGWGKGEGGKKVKGKGNQGREKMENYRTGGKRKGTL